MPVRALRSAALRALSPFLAVGLAATAWAADPAPPAEAAAPAPSAEQATAADPADLGRGLRYFRPGIATADAPAFAAALAAPALVLDLRLAPGDPATAELVRRARVGCTAKRPLFVLLGADTPAALRADLPDTAGLLTLAAKDSAVPAKILISAAQSADRAAAEALVAGRPPRELVEEKIEKARFDEARLVENHANGRSETDATPPDAAKPAATEKAPEPAETAAPLQDLLLQRAIFIHRALLALGRIPEHT